MTSDKGNIATMPDASRPEHFNDSLFRTIFEQSPVSTQIFSRDGATIAVNRAWEELWGVTLEQIGRYNILDDPQLVEKGVMPYILRAFAGEVVDLPTIKYEPDKTMVIEGSSPYRWVRAAMYPVKDESGVIQELVLVHEDITEQKEAEDERDRLLEREQAARQELARLATERTAILGQIADGIIITDASGRITFVNDAARMIHGVAELDVPVDEYSETYHLLTMEGEPYPPEELPLARAVLHGETLLDAEWRIHRPDGTEVVAQGSASPVVDGDGGRLGAVLTVRDVTASHDLERHKSEFLSAAAHDLRTPLTTIKGRVQLLQRRVAAGGSTTEEVQSLHGDLNRIDASATRMMALISELLTVANMQMGIGIDLRVEPTNIVALARSVTEDLGQVVSHHVTFVSTAPEIIGMWDPRRLTRVIANLLSNATKYSPTDGDIAVTVTRDDACAIITIADQGIGIPVQDLPAIFERFHRGRNAEGAVPGTGIGLATVRMIVEEHGGTIDVASQEGSGSTFTVRLPLAGNEASQVIAG
ncbi:MAG: hypothetical protein NVS4B2_17840 [Chloroflexota bacterium]